MRGLSHASTARCASGVVRRAAATPAGPPAPLLHPTRQAPHASASLLTAAPAARRWRQMMRSLASEEAAMAARSELAASSNPAVGDELSPLDGPTASASNGASNGTSSSKPESASYFGNAAAAGAVMDVDSTNGGSDGASASPSSSSGGGSSSMSTEDALGTAGPLSAASSDDGEMSSSRTGADTEASALPVSTPSSSSTGTPQELGTVAAANTFAAAPTAAAAEAAAAQPRSAAAPVLMLSGASMLPHPEKAHRGGEDAFFISEPPLSIGVADGVGGWAEIGVDAGAYARLLMCHAREEAEALLATEGSLSPQTVLERAYRRTNVQGSSTVCILALNGSTLCASNLGDSGFVIVRDGAPAFQSPQQQHNFNFPYQLGSADGGASDHPSSAMRFELTVRHGDIVIAGSDGLWDNVFADEAATIVARCRAQGDGPEAAAHTLCRYARMRATDPKYHSPFSYAAIQAGYVFLGGKLDDITVVVSYVSDSGSSEDSSDTEPGPPEFNPPI